MKESLDVIRERSDGRRYRSTDMVKAGCDGCVDCPQESCCTGMEDTVVLNPWDIAHISVATGMNFETLVSKGYVKLSEDEGLIVPMLCFTGKNESCVFLNSDLRCSIHAHRPGICRLFPLGRIYREDGFDYFLQVNVCPKKTKSKVKIAKWLEVDRIRAYESFIYDWHVFTDELKEEAHGLTEENAVKALSMSFLKVFYFKPYEKDTDLYAQLQARMAAVRELI